MFLSKFFYELTQTDVLSRIGKPQVTNSSTSIGPHWVKSNINSASFKFKFQSSRPALLSSCSSSKTVTILRGIWTITPPSRISSRPKKMAEQNKSFLSFFGPLVQDCDDPRWWIKMHPGGQLACPARSARWPQWRPPPSWHLLILETCESTRLPCRVRSTCAFSIRCKLGS